jgi:hypothetical protein
MTIAGWLRERAPAAPSELVASIEQALGDRAGDDADEAPNACLEAAEELLASLVATPGAGREAALALLTADALVTYAFEAGAQRPGWIAARAPIAMRSFAAAARPA